MVAPSLTDIGRLLAQTPALGLWLVDGEGHTVHANARMAQMLGCELDELLRSSVLDFVFDEDIDLVRRSREQRMQGRSDTLQLRYRRKDALTQVVTVATAPIFDDQGRFSGAVGFHIDTAARREFEDRLDESEQRLEMALSSANAGTWDWDVPSGAVIWSAASSQLLGYEPGSMPNRYAAWSARVHPEDLAVVEGRLHDLIERRVPDYAATYRVLWPDGSQHWIDARGKFVFDEAGRARRMYGVMTDASARKRQEEEQSGARAELEQRVRERTAQLQQRSDQLARLASELTLAEERERHRLAQVLHDELQQLLVSAKYRLDVLQPELPKTALASAQQIEDLLLQSISTARSLTMELSPSILHEAGLAAALQWLARWMKDKHGLDVELQVDPACSVERSDLRVLLFQSVREALFNVGKHAGVRHARVRVWRDGADQLGIVISDEGVGFDPGQLRGADVADAGGFGLFSIDERVNLLGGRLAIDSAPGAGTRLVIRLPLHAKPADEVAAPQPVAAQPEQGNGRAGRRLRVLLVDDHAVMRAGLNALLARQPDVEVVGEAADGRDGVAQARALAPDVILMDFSMPGGMNGAEATRLIHAELPAIRIVGLSMYEEPSVAAAMTKAGAAAYVAKGGNTEALLAAIRAA